MRSALDQAMTSLSTSGYAFKAHEGGSPCFHDPDGWVNRDGLWHRVMGGRSPCKKVVIKSVHERIHPALPDRLDPAHRVCERCAKEPR